jgi:hypothetical protein
MFGVSRQGEKPNCSGDRRASHLSAVTCGYIDLTVALRGLGEVERLHLNAYISSAADGLFTVMAVQMPELTSRVLTLEKIPRRSVPPLLP